MIHVPEKKEKGFLDVFVMTSLLHPLDRQTGRTAMDEQKTDLETSARTVHYLVLYVIPPCTLYAFFSFCLLNRWSMVR